MRQLTSEPVGMCVQHQRVEEIESPDNTEKSPHNTLATFKSHWNNCSTYVMICLVYQAKL